LTTTSTHLRARDLIVAFDGRPALEVESLDIASGEAVAIVGPSGAGKTTLLRAFAALVRPTGGHVEIGGARIDGLSAAELRRTRATIGFVHQHFGLVPNLRVVQNVLTGRLGRQSLAGAMRAMVMPAAADVDRAHAILERVGIADKLYQRTDQLSGGQRQRVALARALFQQPTALLADEPVSSVDPARARDTVALLAEISREQGLTLCASLHNLELAREFFPRLIGLKRGRIAFDRPSAEIDTGEFDSLYELEHSANGNRSG